MVVRDSVLTAIGTLALASIAVIHLVQIVPTFKATPLLGGAFVLLIAGAVALGLVALSRHALTVKRALRPLPVSVLAAANGSARVSSEQRLESA